MKRLLNNIIMSETFTVYNKFKIIHRFPIFETLHFHAEKMPLKCGSSRDWVSLGLQRVCSEILRRLNITRAERVYDRRLSGLETPVLQNSLFSNSDSSLNKRWNNLNIASFIWYSVEVFRREGKCQPLNNKNAVFVLYIY